MTSIQPSPYQSGKVLEYDGYLVGLAKPEFKGLTGQTSVALRKGNPDKKDNNIYKIKFQLNVWNRR